MMHRILRLLVVLVFCLSIPALSLGETYNDSVALPGFTLTDYPAITDEAGVTVQFTGASGYTYVLEHKYNGVWLAPVSVQLSGPAGSFSLNCLQGTNKFVLRNYGQTRNAKSSIPFSIKCTAADAPDTVVLPTPTMKKGSRGLAVKALHQALAEMGVYAGPMSDRFTEDTRKAVIAAQELLAITQDGVVGPQTLHMLDLETYTVETSAIPSNNSGGSDPGSSSSYLEKGMQGDKVKKLQKRLLALGYETGTADGVFGDITLSAVLLYQKNAKITQDGIVGPVTWAKLNSGAASLVPNPPQSRYLKKGHKGEDVREVQAKLIALGYLNDDADGIFGKLTLAAVKAYQEDQGIKVDGIVGPITYGHLFP